MKSENRSVLVLGGTCDIAMTLAPMLISGGITPVLTYRNSSGSEKIDSSLKEYKGLYEKIQIDLSHKESLTAIAPCEFSYMVDLAHTDYESLIAAANPERVTEYYQTNVVNRSILLKEVSRKMLARKFGRLIYLSSTAAERQNPGQGFYSSTKMANEALYKNIGIELARKGITSVSIRAGYIQSGRGSEYLEKNTAIRKEFILTQNEICETIIFLLSKNAHKINATEIIIDGGFTAVK